MDNKSNNFITCLIMLFVLEHVIQLQNKQAVFMYIYMFDLKIYIGVWLIPLYII